MKRTTWWSFLICGAALLTLVTGVATETAFADDAANTPDTYTVTRGPFRIDVSLDGVFEAEQMTPVKVDPETWGSLVIRRIVPHGSEVKAGAPLVWPDAKDIDRAIEDLQAGGRLAEMGIQQAEDELSQLEASLDLNLQQAEEAKTRSDQDFTRYFDVEEDIAKERAQHDLEQAVFSKEYSEGQLALLEKLYGDEKQAAEGERLVLKSQRWGTMHARRGLDKAELDHKRTLQIGLPRREEDLRDSHARQELASEAAEVSLPMNVRRKRLELQKMKYDRAKTLEKLQNLQADRDAMAVTSPADGLLYWGQCVRGKWQGADTIRNALGQGGAIGADQLTLTIVQSRPILARASVPEDKLRHVSEKLTGEAVPTGYPDLKLAATVQKVSLIPVPGGSFETIVALDDPNPNAAVMPGMTCRVKLVAYRKDNAITVPAAAVFEDELDDQQKCVYVFHEGGKPEERRVTTGRKAKGKLEILDGLKEGEQILLSKPDEL